MKKTNPKNLLKYNGQEYDDEYDIKLFREESKNKRTYATLITLFIILVLGMIFLFTFIIKKPLAASCSINNIEYVNVASKGLSCYGEFSARYCPIPHDITCSFSGSLTNYDISKLINGYGVN